MASPTMMANRLFLWHWYTGLKKAVLPPSEEEKYGSESESEDKQLLLRILKHVCEDLSKTSTLAGLGEFGKDKKLRFDHRTYVPIRLNPEMWGLIFRFLTLKEILGGIGSASIGFQFLLLSPYPWSNFLTLNIRWFTDDGIGEQIWGYLGHLPKGHIQFLKICHTAEKPSGPSEYEMDRDTPALMASLLTLLAPYILGFTGIPVFNNAHRFPSCSLVRYDYDNLPSELWDDIPHHNVAKLFPNLQWFHNHSGDNWVSATLPTTLKYFGSNTDTPGVDFSHCSEFKGWMVSAREIGSACRTGAVPVQTLNIRFSGAMDEIIFQEGRLPTVSVLHLQVILTQRPVVTNDLVRYLEMYSANLLILELVLEMTIPSSKSPAVRIPSLNSLQYLGITRHSRDGDVELSFGIYPHLLTLDIDMPYCRPYKLEIPSLSWTTCFPSLKTLRTQASALIKWTRIDTVTQVDVGMDLKTCGPEISVLCDLLESFPSLTDLCLDYSKCDQVIWGATFPQTGLFRSLGRWSSLKQVLVCEPPTTTDKEWNSQCGYWKWSQYLKFPTTDIGFDGAETGIVYSRAQISPTDRLLLLPTAWVDPKSIPNGFLPQQLLFHHSSPTHCLFKRHNFVPTPFACPRIVPTPEEGQ